MKAQKKTLKPRRRARSKRVELRRASGGGQRRLDSPAQADRETRLQAILATTTDAIITLDVNGIIESANPAARAIFGYTPKQIIGRDIAEIIPESLNEDRNSIKAAMAALGRKKNGNANHEALARRRNGAVFPVELSLGKTMVSKRPLYICFVHNITNRKEAERNLYDNEQRFRTLVTASPDALFINRNGRIAFINSAGLRMFGATSIEQMLGRKVLDLFHRDCHAMVRERLAELYAGREMPLAEEQIVRLDGVVRDVEVAASPFEDSSGRAIQVTLRDITVRNEAKQTLLHYAAMVESSEDAIIGETLEGYITSWNRGAEAVFGYGRTEVIAKHISIIIPPERAPEESHILAKVRIGQSVEHYETVRQRKDGRLIDISVTVSPIRNSKGEIVGAAKIARDITSRRQLEREVLEISDREQRTVGYDIHDGLCQQLAGIELKSQVLEQKLEALAPEEAPRAAEIGQNVRESIAYARALARSLAPVTLETDGLISALHELALTVETLFKVRCVFDCDIDLPPQNRAAATHMYRLAQEAISNAIKHGKATQISIHFKKDPDRIYLGISDNGVGVPEQPYTHHGMGLRIMQSRAGMVGGTLTIERNLTGGTTVICSAPYPSPPPTSPNDGNKL